MKKNRFTNYLSRIHFNLERKKPELFLAGGIAAGIGCVVTVFFAARKLDPVLEKNQRRVALARKAADASKEDDAEGRALIKAHTENALDLAKLFLPPAMLGSVSIVCALSSHHTMHQRLTGVIAAYGSLSTAFKEYRKRVKDEFGEEIDQHLRYGSSEVKEETTVTDDEGNTRTVTRTRTVYDHNGNSIYARLFEAGMDGWDPDPEYTLNFLKSQQSVANDLLHSRGYLFLCEVYEMLGIRETKASRVVGWIYEENNPCGDNFVDFGLYDKSPQTRAFLEGVEDSVLLDFNVDGVIIDRAVELKMMAGC